VNFPFLEDVMFPKRKAEEGGRKNKRSQIIQKLEEQEI